LYYNILFAKGLNTLILFAKGLNLLATPVTLQQAIREKATVANFGQQFCMLTLSNS
jgi:hypothetical protein